MNTSVLWVTCASFARTETFLTKLRTGGMLPLRVESVEVALKLLRQFRAGTIVHHAAAPGALAECALLVESGAPVVVLTHDLSSSARYLAAGCTAVVLDTCSGAIFAQIVQDVAAGKRDIIWPASPAAAVEIA